MFILVLAYWISHQWKKKDGKWGIRISGLLQQDTELRGKKTGGERERNAQLVRFAFTQCALVYQEKKKQTDVMWGIVKFPTVLQVWLNSHTCSLVLVICPSSFLYVVFV